MTFIHLPRSLNSSVACPQIGPRMELEVMKVQEGLCDGKVLYHKYETKTAEEASELQSKKEQQERLRAQRRHQQEENVRRWVPPRPQRTTPCWLMQIAVFAVACIARPQLGIAPCISRRSAGIVFGKESPWLAALVY